MLQWTTDLTAPISWQTYPAEAVVQGGNFVVSLQPTNSQAFFRLVIGITTLPATQVKTNAAILNGSVLSSADSTAWFQYGTTTDYDQTTSTTPVSGSSTDAVGVSSPIDGLTPGTLYHSQLVVANSAGTNSGGDLTFTTPQPPLVFTANISSITTTSAVLNATINGEGSPSVAYFQYGTDTTYTLGQHLRGYFTVFNTDTEPFNYTLTGLTPNTTYHYRAYGFNCCLEGFGDDVTFTTAGPQPPPIVSTTNATSITSTSAVLNGTINGEGSQAVAHFEYGTNTTYTGGHAGTYFTSFNGDTEPFSYSVTGLTPNTTYHYRAFGFNCCTEGFGADSTFTTAAVVQPLVLNCLSNITVAATSSNGAAVFFTSTASGGCSPPPSVNCYPPSGSTFPIGTTVVTCTASDACGSTTNCAFQLKVNP